MSFYVFLSLLTSFIYGFGLKYVLAPVFDCVLYTFNLLSFSYYFEELVIEGGLH